MIEKANVSGGIKAWKMLGNNIDGDCVVAAYYHILMAKNMVRANPLVKMAYRLGFRAPGPKFAIEEYTAYLATLNEKPGPEQGVAVEGWLAWQEAQGKVTAWAQVRNPETPDFEDRVRQAMVDFGGVILAGGLSRNAYNDWGPGTCWEYDPNVPGDQSDPTLGHAIAMLACQPTKDYAVTWGYWQTMTVAFRQANMTGAFVYLHADDEKLPDYADRLAKMNALKAP